VEGQVPVATAQLRKVFKGKISAAGGFEPDSAEAIVEKEDANLVAFGRHFLANPDLLKGIKASQRVRSREFRHARFPRLNRLSVPRRAIGRFTHSAETVSRTKARAHEVLDRQKYLDALGFPRSRPHSDS
jgi:NADH:flavin oxidoreductase / NADH oxidase family